MAGESKNKLSRDRRRFLKTAGAWTALGAIPAAGAAAAPAKGRHPHKFEEMLPEEFYRQLQRMPVGYLPIGAMEEHGLQSTLAVDPWTAYEVCLRTANRIGGIVHPIVPIAPAGHPSWPREELRRRKQDQCPPSVWVGRETCKQLYIELLEMFADLDFQFVMAYSGHWPGEVLLDEIYREYQGVMRGMKFWGGGMLLLLKPELEKFDRENPLLFGHGMMWETSLLQAINPGWVEMDRVKDIKESPISHQLKVNSVERINAIRMANAELGNQWLNLTVDRMGEMARQALKKQG